MFTLLLSLQSSPVHYDVKIITCIRFCFVRERYWSSHSLLLCYPHGLSINTYFFKNHRVLSLNNTDVFSHFYTGLLPINFFCIVKATSRAIYPHIIVSIGLFSCILTLEKKKTSLNLISHSVLSYVNAINVMWSTGYRGTIPL